LAINVRLGDVFEVLGTYADGVFDAIWSSPPYWQVREYPIVEGAVRFGEEPTSEEYIQRTVDLFREFRRVLSEHASVWWNVGDCWFKGGQEGKKRSMALIPWRAAQALSEDGWYIRNTVAWTKSSRTPDPVDDRLVAGWEPVLFLSPGPRPFFDSSAIRYRSKDAVHPLGVMPSDWLTTGKSKGKDGHFAQQPYDLVASLLGAVVPKSVCIACNMPVKTRMVVERQAHGEWREERDRTWRHSKFSPGNHGLRNRGKVDSRSWSTEEVGCDCEAGYRSGVVLDPFCGAGTTLQAAHALGVDAVGIDACESAVETTRKKVDRLEAQMDLFRCGS
jgi:hypothetical protein